MRRFFIDPTIIKDNRLSLSGPEVHHMANVLRLKAGETICLYDGTGQIYSAEIVALNAQKAQLVIIGTEEEKNSGSFLHLCQGLLTGKKMDLIVQKATELGIESITPFISSRSTVRRQVETKNDRWRKIALEACKQCGRPTPPLINEPIKLSELLAQPTQHPMKIIFWEDENQQTLEGVINKNAPADSGGDILFIIGPEGGFSHDEIDHALENGFMPATLGRRTLRAETAAIAAAAVLQYLCGNMGQE